MYFTVETHSVHTVYIVYAVQSVHQARPSPNPMSPKLHRFATKITVCDLFALGLEQLESKKLAKVRTTFQKNKYFFKKNSTFYL